MAIIYSYPVVQPTTDDLVLGTDATDASKPTKNFTVQSIIDLVTVSGNDLQAVLNNGNVATGRDINLTNNNFRGGSFITTGNATITGTIGTGFTQITADDFVGDLTGIVKAGSSIESTVTGVTQSQGDNSTKLATTAYVDGKVDPSVLQYLGDSTGPFDLNLISDDFKIAGTANEIETTATTVAGNVGTVTLSFPTAGVTLPDGSVATTQALTDNSTKVATTAFVHGKNDAQTLNFSNGSNASTVLLNSQTFVVSGTTNQIATATTPQTITIGLTTDVTIAGTYTGATFSGDLNGTVNTATTGTTQSAGDNSTKIATTAYVDSAAGAKILQYKDSTSTVHDLNLSDDDLQFNGDSNITVTADAVSSNVGAVTVDLNNDVTISGTMQAGTLSDGTFSGTGGTYTGGVSITSTDFVGALTGNADTATALASSGAIALTGDTTSTGGPYTYTSGGALSIATTIADTTVTGKVLTNLPTATSQVIADSDTILEALSYLQGQITGIPQGLVYKGTWNASTNTPTLASGTGVTGEFYIVSVAGTTNLDGITDWQVGDWAIFVEVGATDTWQKIDNTSAILGSGTANKIAKWTGSNTLATGLIADDGSTVTIGNSGNLVVEGNTTLGDADTDSTTVKGPAVFEETVRINEGISLGANTYGTVGQVLTSGGGSASVNTWTTPTTGTVTSVAAGTGITIGGTAADPTVAIDYLGTDNAILSAPQENAIATTDTVWFSDATDNNIKKTTVANLIALDGARSLAATLAVGNTTGGTSIDVSANDDINLSDSSEIHLGDGADLVLKHNGSLGTIQNNTGNLQIVQNTNDGDIKFFNDDGAGGTENYLQIDGGEQNIKVFNNMRFSNDVQLRLGTGSDLRIYHNGTTGNSNIDNYTGDLYFTQNTDDGDIIFRSDDGSGGVAEYFKLDGSLVNGTTTLGAVNFPDKSKIFMGTGNDLEIYHDGSNSYIDETGAGSLLLKTSSLLVRNPSDASMLDAQSGGPINLYYNGSQKFATTANGVTILGQGLLMEGTSSPQEAVLTMGTLNNAPTIKMMRVGNNYIYSPNGNIVLRSGGTPVDGLRVAGSTVILSQYGQGNRTGSPTYDLAVNSSGSIIEVEQAFPSQKSGIFNGYSQITANTNAATLFTVTRESAGQLIFDVWITTFIGSMSRYVVAHGKNQTPIYNKLLQAPGAGGSSTSGITISFDNATSSGGTTGNSVACKITTDANWNTTNVNWTVQVGYMFSGALSVS